MFLSNFRDLLASSHGVYSESLASQGGRWRTRAAVGGGSAAMWWALKSSVTAADLVAMRGWREHWVAAPAADEEVMGMGMVVEWVQIPMR